MDKAFGFLLAVFLLTILGSFAVIVVLTAVDYVKELIDDWRE